MKIFLDIETIPLGPEPVFNAGTFPGVRVPANYRNQETIDKYIAENTGSAVLAWEKEQEAAKEAQLLEWKKGALKATRSQIICICAITNKFESVFKFSSSDEFEVLNKFSEWIFNFVPQSTIGHTNEFIGHNVAFDLQMLRTHASKHMLHGLVDLLTFEKWPKNIHCTMEIWAGVRKDDRTKLPEIAEFLGIENRNGKTTGAEIYDFYKAGRFEEIEVKCLNDTLMCKEVYERIS